MMGFDINEEALVSRYGDQQAPTCGSQHRKQATRTSKRNLDCQKRHKELKLVDFKEVPEWTWERVLVRGGPVKNVVEVKITTRMLTWWNERTLSGGCARESLRKKSKTRNINTSGRTYVVPVHSRTVTSQKIKKEKSLLFKSSSL